MGDSGTGTKRGWVRSGRRSFGCGNGQGAGSGRAARCDGRLFNLVDNAVKYGAPADDPRIHLRVARAGSAVEFSVCDHGPGVADPVIAHLFTPFSKTAETAAETAPGVGLGLALSRRLARRMGGDLRLDPPADPGGACFVLRLPLAA